MEYEVVLSKEVESLIDQLEPYVEPVVLEVIRRLAKVSYLDGEMAQAKHAMRRIGTM